MSEAKAMVAHASAADPSPGQQPKLNFPFVDALRAVAALMVLVYHVIQIGNWKSFPFEGWLLTFRVGWLGVDLFFVISGFVIAGSALRDYQAEPKDFRRRFMGRRFLRIVPLYVLTCIVYLMVVKPNVFHLAAGPALIHVLSHALFVHNLHPGTHGSINGVNWSVALEMQFYLFVVFLIPFLLRRGLWMVFLLLPLAIGYRFLTTLIVPPVTGSNTHLQHVLAAQLPGTLDAFSLGIMLALMVHARSEFLRGLVACNWRNFFCWSVVAALVGTWTMSVYLNHAEYWNNVYMVVFWRSAIALTFACILAAAITFPGAGWLVFGPIRYLGEISYGLYLWHLPVLMTVLSVSRVEGVQLLVVVLCCTLILSAYTWHRFEKPIMERFRPA